MQNIDKKLPYDRSFGILLLALTGLLFIYTFYYSDYIFFSTVVSGAFFFILALVTTFFPFLLRPLKISWLFLGLILSKIFTPLVLRVIFYLIFTPFAILSKIVSRDELILKKPQKQSFWLSAEAKTISLEYFKKQF